MGLQFDRPVGAPKDVAELEYCCSIRQTDTSRALRANGSLTGDDVRLHLLSRHGVAATLSEVENSILLQLAGGQEYAVPVAPAASPHLLPIPLPVPIHHRGRTPATTTTTMSATTTTTTQEPEVAASASASASAERIDEEEGGGSGHQHHHPPLRVALEGPEEERASGGGKSGMGGPDRSQGGSNGGNHSGSGKEGGTGGDVDGGPAGTSSGTTTTPTIKPPLLLRRVTPLDLVQQVALLLVPELIKLQAEAHGRSARDAQDQGEGEAEEVATGRGQAHVGGNNGNGNGGAPPLRASLRPSLSSAAAASARRRQSQGIRQSVRDLFQRPSDDDLVPPTIDAGVVELALLVLLENAGLVYGTELTTDVVHQLLLSLGEEYWDDDVVEQMIRLASPTSSGATTKDEENADDDEEGETRVVKLTSETFLRALTADVAGLYDPKMEMRVTTHFADAGAPGAPTPTSSSRAKTEQELGTSSATAPSPSLAKSTTNPNLNPGAPYTFPRVFTASSIDYTADTYASLTWAVLVWFLLAGFFFNYMFDGLQRRMFPLGCNSEEFGCKIANAVVLWLEIMIKLCLVGFVYIGLSTLGNSVYLLTTDNATTLYKIKAATTIVISLATVYASTMLAYLVHVDAVVFDTTVPPPDDDYGGVVYYLGDDPSLAASGTSSPRPPPQERRDMDVIVGSSLAVGFICMLAQLAQLVRAVLPRDLDAPARVTSLLASSANTMEHKTKTAASHKVREMVRNAVSCHALVSGPSDEGLATSLKYEAKNPMRLLAQNVDGRISHALFHFQERLQDRETVGGLFYTLNGLLRGGSPLATQEGIWVHPRLLWCNLGQLIVIVALIVLLVQLPIAWTEGFDLDGITVQQFKSVIVAGGIVALFACLGTATRFVPSAITTVLMFRSGAHSTLRDNRSFHVYRFAQDTSTALFGSAIWGLFFTGGIIWAVVSLIAFLFAWESTREIMLSFLAQIMGVVVTIAIKIIAMQILRRTWYGGFYRKRPGGANVFMVFIECWNLALSSGYILARSIKFIVLSILYISRVDTPFLADGAGWLVGSIPLDAYAISFRKDILIHDAHRHPYMERWATLFLLKLRHGDKFGSQAGAAWRILFTMALMPWLRNYRVHPKLRASAWSTRHSSAMLLHGGGAGGGDSYEDLFTRNQALEREVQRLKKELAAKAAEEEEAEEAQEKPSSEYIEL